MGFWNLDLQLNGVISIHSLPKDVCELAVRLLFYNLIDFYNGRRYHIGFKHKRGERSSNILYSNLFRQHIELSMENLCEFQHLTSGGLDYEDYSSYSVIELCTYLDGDAFTFSGD